MAHILNRRGDPAIAGFGDHGLVRRAIRAVSGFRLARAKGVDTRERRFILIKQDLAHLERKQLRDIGLDRGAS
jgi:hypothetical protein